MKNTPKIMLCLLAVGLFSLNAEASTKPSKSINYEIKKDSLSISPAVDTTKKTITFPNPFSVFILEEEKTNK